jgi:glutathione peroxidase
MMRLVYLFAYVFWLSACRSVVRNPQPTQAPPTDFYGLSFESLEGQPISMAQFKGKKVLIVNTASKCGHTIQLEALENLYKTYASSLVVIGFPCNQFMGQEPGNVAQIREFCQRNYGVTFLIAKKADVKGSGQQPVFQWLCDAKKNGWNSQSPEWNFSKYLVDEQGRLLAKFPSRMSPSDPALVDLLK